MAVLAPAVRYVVVRSVNWTPVEMPLGGDPGTAHRQDFSVDQSGQYELAVRIDRPPVKSRSDHAECLLGFDWVECAGIAPLTFHWDLESDDGSPPGCGDEPRTAGVVEGRSSGGRFTPAVAERWLGCVDAHEDVRYALEVDVLSDLDELAPFNPRVVVVSSDALDRDEYSLTAAVWLTSLLAGFAALLLLADNRA